MYDRPSTAEGVDDALQGAQSPDEHHKESTEFQPDIACPQTGYGRRQSWGQLQTSITITIIITTS